MGEHHVPLNINEEGLVISIGSNKYETCVICGKLTDVLVSTHIDYRYGYVEGCGQCCKECYNGKNNKEKNYIKEVMKNRTTLITISAEDILNTPNDSDLGAKIREIYWSTRKEEIKSKWTCSLCGDDTSNVDYDYLIGYDHLSCHLIKENENKVL